MYSKKQIQANRAAVQRGLDAQARWLDKLLKKEKTTARSAGKGVSYEK